ncbi:MAG: oligosaccharide flippase family protein [Melioribacteraceae bacterium]
MIFEKRNSIWLSVQFLFSIIISFVSIKLNILSFGSEVFGIWIILASLWGLSATIDFGFGTSIIKYVAENQSDVKKVEIILSSVFYIYILMGLVLLVLGYTIGFIYYLNNPSLISGNNRYMYYPTFFILGISFLLQYYGLFFKSVIEGHKNFIFTSKVILVQQILLIFGVLIIYFFLRSIIYLSIVYCISSFVAFLLYFSFTKLRYSQYSMKIGLFSFNEAKGIISFSIAVQAMSLFNSLIDPMVKYILGVYYSINSVPAYEIARRFAIAISGLFFNAYKVILPKVSSLDTDQNRKNFAVSELIDYCKNGISYAGIFFGISIFPLTLLILWFYKIPEALVIFIILSLPECINVFGYPIYNYLLGVGRVKVLSFIQINNFIITSILLWVGFKFTNTIWGLLGYFISVVFANYLMLHSLRSYAKISLYDFLHNCGFTRLVVVVLLLIASLFSLFLMPTKSIQIFVTTSLLNALVFRHNLRNIFGDLMKKMNYIFGQRG